MNFDKLIYEFVKQLNSDDSKIENQLIICLLNNKLKLKEQIEILEEFNNKLKLENIKLNESISYNSIIANKIMNENKTLTETNNNLIIEIKQLKELISESTSTMEIVD